MEVKHKLTFSMCIILECSCSNQIGASDGIPMPVTDPIHSLKDERKKKSRMWVVKGSEVPILAPWVCVKEQDKEGTSCDSEQIPEADWETQHGDLHRGLF